MSYDRLKIINADEKEMMNFYSVIYLMLQVQTYNAKQNYNISAEKKFGGK